MDLSNQYGGLNKRQTSTMNHSSIRIHPEFVNVTPSATTILQGTDSILFRSIKTLESILMVHPVQGNFIIPPMCTEYTSGVNEGKCRSPLPTQSDYRCRDFLDAIPPSYIGVREVCTSPNSTTSCTLQGPNGTGIPNTDYLLFVSTISSGKLTVFLELYMLMSFIYSF